MEPPALRGAAKTPSRGCTDPRALPRAAAHPETLLWGWGALRAPPGAGGPAAPTPGTGGRRGGRRSCPDMCAGRDEADESRGAGEGLLEHRGFGNTRPPPGMGGLPGPPLAPAQPLTSSCRCSSPLGQGVCSWHRPDWTPPTKIVKYLGAGSSPGQRHPLSLFSPSPEQRMEEREGGALPKPPPLPVSRLGGAETPPRQNQPKKKKKKKSKKRQPKKNHQKEMPKGLERGRWGRPGSAGDAQFLGSSPASPPSSPAHSAVHSVRLSLSSCMMRVLSL